jgi:hypothetical protein
MRLPILISAIAILLQAGTQPIAPQSTDYAARARRAVEDELRKSGQPPDAFRIEILLSREFPLPQGDMYMLPLPVFLIREGQALRVAGAFQAGG